MIVVVETPDGVDLIIPPANMEHITDEVYHQFLVDSHYGKRGLPIPTEWSAIKREDLPNKFYMFRRAWRKTPAGIEVDFAVAKQVHKERLPAAAAAIDRTKDLDELLAIA